MESTTLLGNRHQKGVALITALLVVALATIAATAMVTANNIAIRRSGNILQSEAESWYLTGLEQWAGQILRRDSKNSKIDDLSEAWAQKVTLPIDGGTLKGQLVDAQGLFNINNMRSGNPALQKKAFERLVTIVMSQNNADEGMAVDPKSLANAVFDWMSPGTEVTFPGGAKDQYYRGLSHPYRISQQPMASPSELLLVKGMTPKIYRALRPYVTTLPPGTPLNVNTAPWQVLAAEIPAMRDPEVAQACVKYRAQNPFKTPGAFLGQSACIPFGSNTTQAQENLSVNSQYFLAEGQASVGDGRMTLYSLLYRNNGITRVLAHSRSVF